MKTRRDRVRSNFTSAVWRLCLERMLFVDWQVLCRAVYFACRSVNQTLDPVIERRLAKIQCTPNVRVDKAIGRSVGIGNWNKCSEMKDNLDTFGKFKTVVRIANVSGNYLDALE